MITIGGKDIADISIDNKNVIRVQDATTLEIMWQKTTPVVVDYFYIENTFNGSNSIAITTQYNSPTGNHATTLQYSKDKTNWTTITLSGTNTISMDSGDKVYFRNDNGYFNWYNSSSNRFVTNLNCSENFNVGGNINSLLDYTNSNVSLSPYCFYSLFNDSTSFKLVNASNLTLPSTTLAEHCYERMFYNRSNLTTIPTLPATTLADYCYSYMFSGCTSLTTPPSLPATTLEDYCYQRMFSGCTALTTTPTLSSTTLAEHCYSYMFNGCTSLTTTQSLPATTLERYCYEDMFRGCSSLTSVPTLSSTTLADGCYAYMFYGCTSLTTAPSLPATTLTQSCYNNMFYGCTALITPPTLPATTLASGCYNRMFYNCSSLNYINVYANDISASNCIVNWLYGVASTGTFNNFGSASYTYPSASGIPQGWSEVSMVYTKLEYIANNYQEGYSGNTDVVAGIRFSVPYTSNFVIDCEVIGGTPQYGDQDYLFDLFYTYYSSNDSRYLYRTIRGIHTNTGEPTYNSHILDNRMTTNVSDISYVANTNYSIHCTMSTSYVNNQVLYNGTVRTTSNTVYLTILQESLYNVSTGAVFYPRNTGTNYRRGSTYKLKSMKVWDGNTLLYDFIPVKRNSDNEVCLFDKVSQTFFTKNSECTLSFIAGPVTNS